jgi:hypothetical protein
MGLNGWVVGLGVAPQPGLLNVTFPPLPPNGGYGRAKDGLMEWCNMVMQNANTA